MAYDHSHQRVETLLAASKESARRTRLWVYVSSLASLIVIVTWWHTGPGDWGRLRISELSYVITGQTPPGANVDPARLRELLDEWGLDSKDQSDVGLLRDIRRELLRVEAEKYEVRIPALAAYADARDLGVTGGAALAVLSLIVSRCVHNERRTMTTAVRVAEELDEKQYAHDAMSAHHVLIVTPDRDASKDERDIARQAITDNIPFYALLFLPLMAQGCVVGSTFVTVLAEKPRLLSMTTLVLIGSCCALLAIAYWSAGSTLSAHRMLLHWGKTCRQSQ
jgi:hypothetical protein